MPGVDRAHGAGEVRYDVEPQTGGGQRAWIQFLTILPIDWML
jgi:hypothetical protein